jgi:hypothetical protein
VNDRGPLSPTRAMDELLGAWAARPVAKDHESLGALLRSQSASPSAQPCASWRPPACCAVRYDPEDEALDGALCSPPNAKHR